MDEFEQRLIQRLNEAKRAIVTAHGLGNFPRETYHAGRAHELRCALKEYRKYKVTTAQEKDAGGVM